MKLTADQRKEWEALAEKMSDWLMDNCHPHVITIIDNGSAQLHEGMISTGQRGTSQVFTRQYPD